MKTKTKMGNKKKGAIYSLVGLMVCMAVYLNWSYTSSPNEELVSGDKNYGDSKLVDLVDDSQITSVVNGNDKFSTAKLTRQTSRDEAISILNETIGNESLSEEARQTASEAVMSISNNAIKEGNIESVMLAKGYEKSVVFINDQGVNVLVSKTDGEFTASDAAIIKDVVVLETGLSSDKIKIVESN